MKLLLLAVACVAAESEMLSRLTKSVTLTPRPRCAVLIDKHVAKHAGTTLRSIFLENAHRDGWAYWGYG